MFYYKITHPTELVAQFDKDYPQVTVSPDYNYVTVSHWSLLSIFKAADYANNHKLPVDITHLFNQDNDAFWNTLWVPGMDTLVLQYRNYAAVSKTCLFNFC